MRLLATDISTHRLAAWQRDSLSIIKAYRHLSFAFFALLAHWSLRWNILSEQCSFPHFIVSFEGPFWDRKWVFLFLLVVSHGWSGRIIMWPPHFWKKLLGADGRNMGVLTGHNSYQIEYFFYPVPVSKGGILVPPSIVFRASLRTIRRFVLSEVKSSQSCHIDSVNVTRNCFKMPFFSIQTGAI